MSLPAVYGSGVLRLSDFLDLSSTCFQITWNCSNTGRVTRTSIEKITPRTARGDLWVRLANRSRRKWAFVISQRYCCGRASRLQRFLNFIRNWKKSRYVSEISWSIQKTWYRVKSLQKARRLGDRKEVIARFEGEEVKVAEEFLEQGEDCCKE